MIKLIVSDLDGTLLNRDHQIQTEDQEAIKKARANDYHICFASGRMFTELSQVMQHFDEQFFAVSQNGATVHTNTKKLIASNHMNTETALELFRATRIDDLVNFIYCTDDSFYFTERTKETIAYEARVFGTGVEKHDLESALASNELQPSKFSFFGELDKLRSLQADLSAQFKGKLELYISDKDCLDVMPVHVSKGEGLSVLIHHLGLQRDEVACIGDSFNDLSMFALTPYSFAMKNSQEEVQKHARHVVQSVADAVEWVFEYNQSLTGSY
ncbi:Cof-type HAD-IIB family hydrolase [Paenibacillus sediminis]|uniref:Cof subfamily protein (Haloacid dehalogenase superfamily) n=1 Tax=Paenibacillus sediminis TaxID=664909 RepID=A0ABS4H250_9BACL|nr:Cof-type HAD-IIB family hydrolase [Paenibacillus sediminis]MBP1936190.1 Cof subfamily protein (haloacid dehalogenase superfamily) [Paenibacillus sediminis]